MDNLLTLSLEAHHPERNHRRFYRISVGRDLLDNWLVCIRYGRIGQSGQSKHFGGSSAESMQKIIRDYLLRRLSAPKRIGCSYRISDISVDVAIHPSAWFPPEILDELRF